MDHVPDDLLMAFVDGELSEQERAWLEGVLAKDPQLRRRLEPFAVTRATLPLIFDQPMREPIPDRLLETIRTAGRAGGAAEPARGSRERQQTARPAAAPGSLKGMLEGLFSSGFGWQPALGYAATLLVGVGAGWLGSGLIGGSTPDETLMRVDRGSIVASGRLEEALNRAPSSGKSALIEGAIRPVLTLRNNSGEVCRQYEMIGRNRKDAGGLACRDEDGAWRITVLSNGAGSGSTRQVSQGDDGKALDPAVGDAIKNLGRYETLSEAEEAFLIEKGWPGPTAAPSGK